MFLFFGCWNNIDCKSTDKPYRYRDIVLDFIHHNEKEVKDFFIAGDNWYPNLVPTKNIEYYFTIILKSGYDMIYKLQKNTYIVLGNHDEISMDMMERKFKTCMFNTQLYYIENVVSKNIRTPTLELLDALYNQQSKPKLHRHNSFTLVKQSQTQVPKRLTRSVSKKLTIRQPKILLYDDIESIIKQKYIMIFINTNRIHDIDYLTRLEQHMKIYSKTQLPKFVMGHLPIFYFRDNNKFRHMKTEHPTKTEDEKFADIQTLYNILVDNNCIYLCADTHCFEIMNINQENKSLLQIIAGTGGGIPDVVSNDNHNFNKTIESGYNIQGNCVNSYGYCKIDVKSQNLIQVHYIKVINHDEQGQVLNNYMIFTYNIVLNGKIWGYEVADANAPITYSLDLTQYNRHEICSQIKDPRQQWLNKEDPLVVFDLEGKRPCFEKQKDKDKNKKTDK